MRRIRVVLFTVVILIILSIFASRTAFVLHKRDYTPSNLLRLHVIANSNSLFDQSIKREVRNEIIASSKELFKDVKNMTDASDIAKNEIQYLTKVAEQQIERRGKNYNISIKVEETYFPKRTYGEVTLAEGDYQAVKVIIGKGEGANWWCVLFPPLCFVDSADEVSPKVMQAEHNKVNLANQEEIEVQFKFKFLEYIQDNPELLEKKLNLAKIFSWMK